MKAKLAKAFLVDTDLECKTTEQKFLDNASMTEGVSGQLAIDTTYENTSPDPEASSRSQWDGESIPLK